MNEIKCPNCGKVFTIDEAGFASIVKQVRDKEFAKELADREKLLNAERERAVSLAVEKTKNALQQETAARDAQLADLKAKNDALEQQRELYAKTKVADVEKQRDQLAAQLKEQEAAVRLAQEQARAALAAAAAEKDAKIAQLQQKLDAQDESFATKQQLAVTEAVSVVEKQRDQLQAQVKLAESEQQRIEADLKAQMAERLKAKDDIIAMQKEDIERVKDMKAKLSTKMLGESLEQHCQIEFNRLRATAFPNAYFEKDNDASEGSKGDFIYREADGAGQEIISIMFEMKNEQDDSTHRHKNEDFFKKLDSDRAKKGCEYAVLVTLLEPENELYNTGIVDVSYQYEKMYVIRPQFFIPMITVLRNAALNSMTYKAELAQMRQENIDITNFEAEMEDFKDRFGRNYRIASERFETAIAEIDKTIDHLEKTKKALLSSENNLRLANDKAEDLSIKKLTRNNPTMRERFDELGEGSDD